MNHIHYLIGANGDIYDSQVEIQNHCIEYFSDLLGGEVSNTLFLQEDITNLLDFSCSDEQQLLLDRDFSSEDIKHAFFSLPRNKTSGPDGFFFIGCWSVVGAEVVAAVKEFFSSGTILKQWNATTLVLIPKITNASKASDFRPISCLNTVYKLISKLLSSRLQSSKILSFVISHSQSAFMPGRLLAENVLLATEIVHRYNRQNISKRAMLKVDLKKAFDSVRWDFVLSTLRGINCPEKFVNWISQCISTASFSVSINGNTSGFLLHHCKETSQAV